ncbi:hypothetical protein PRIPAC_72357 [Pristionchus pacificus]|uniref:Uncharacterized protein n=1 Tax=Pristionchus pacificus TaxID=54126 RepID=A0A2A6D0R5_PRIPA|nr:hypothetical protein PRIPAC_72357 [Pristionchus pacificus]|eukprot:PDM83873.1 hypothetical protein PRIPAC_30360 [Pristionchus pacificus]
MGTPTSSILFALSFSHGYFPHFSNHFEAKREAGLLVIEFLSQSRNPHKRKNKEQSCMEFSKDSVIAHLKEAECEFEPEERKRKRRSKINTPESLEALKESGDGEEGDILLNEGSPISDFCEVMVGERSSGDFIRELEEQKREEVAVLLKMMINRGLKPVKTSDWAEEAGIDDYYLNTYAQEACKKLPPGIVKMKKEEFVMGDALTEYVNLTKIIYAHEVVVILDEEDKIKEKEIAFNLGVSSLEGFLKMKTIAEVFYVEKKNGELQVSMRV